MKQLLVALLILSPTLAQSIEEKPDSDCMIFLESAHIACINSKCNVFATVAINKDFPNHNPKILARWSPEPKEWFSKGYSKLMYSDRNHKYYSFQVPAPKEGAIEFIPYIDVTDNETIRFYDHNYHKHATTNYLLGNNFGTSITTRVCRNT